MTEASAGRTLLVMAENGRGIYTAHVHVTAIDVALRASGHAVEPTGPVAA